MRLDLNDGPKKEPADWRRWRTWFAWRPVIVDGVLVWLEPVEWRYAGVYPRTMVCPVDYRLPNQHGRVPTT